MSPSHGGAGAAQDGQGVTPGHVLPVSALEFPWTSQRTRRREWDEIRLWIGMSRENTGKGRDTNPASRTSGEGGGTSETPELAGAAPSWSFPPHGFGNAAEFSLQC